MRCIAYSPSLAHYAPMLAKQIGQNIRAARKAKKPTMSLQVLAAKIVPPTRYQTIGKFEKGQRPLTIDWIEKIAKALDVDPLELIAPGGVSQTEPSFHLDEQVVIEASRSLAAAATGEPDPEPGTVEAVALVLRELTATFSRHPETAVDVRVARPVIDQLMRRFVPATN